jgi:hypothetical protein
MKVEVVEEETQLLLMTQNCSMMKNLVWVDQKVEMNQMVALMENPMGDPKGDLENIIMCKKNNSSHKKERNHTIKS